MKWFILNLLLLCIYACSPSAAQQPVQSSLTANTQGKAQLQQLLAAEADASQAGRRILQVGRKMALERKEIIRGSCWDYIHTVYNRAGFPSDKRHKVHRGKKADGPYASADNIQPGDWLYYINHQYNGIEHSGIFVRWVDRKKRSGEILSYGGEKRHKPGRYRNYDLSHVYMIIRAKP